MQASAFVPLSIAALTTDELSRKIMAIQGQLGGKVQILAIYWDGRRHVCWYYPLTNLGVV